MPYSVSRDARGKTPLDIDPEEDASEFDASSNSEPEEDAANGYTGREHYEKVGRSRLRDAAALGPQYAGAKARRRDVGEDSDKHDPFAEYDDEEDSDDLDGVVDRMESGASPDNTDADMEDMRSDDEEQDEDLKYGLANGSRAKRQEKDDGEELKRLLGESNNAMATSLAESQKTDATKGLAVRQQRKTFDSLLNTRIRLQNGMVAMNTLPVAENHHGDDDIRKAAQSAQAAARKLWSTLDSLRCDIADSKTGEKRKRGSADGAIGSMWNHMSSLESTSSASRRANIKKWSEKTQPASVKKSSTSKLFPDARRQAGILDVLDEQLADTDRLTRKTKIPRSGAPVQAKEWTAQRRARGRDNDEEQPADQTVSGIFDDADFYSMLLKELLDQRRENATSDSNPLMNGNAAPDLESEYRNASSKSAATKKVVDTRASKGRKMRYTVHEKLLNFMVPEDRGSWSDRQAKELFAGLFGRRGGLADGTGTGDADHDHGADQVESALRLFRG